MLSGSPGEVLTGLYRAGVEAAAAGPALTAALERAPDPAGGVWIVAAGKAAHEMASAAVAFLAARNLRPAGGVVVGADRRDDLEGLVSVVGDHPFPGGGSLSAAGAIGELAELTQAGDEAWVLLSGGATSLAAAPIPGVPSADLFALYRLLLSSGLDIARMNTVRKRFSRWGAGRLAVALHPARVRTFIVSDVIGDDVAAIGSGPCVADPARASDVRRLLQEAGLWEQVPHSIRQHLTEAEKDPGLETPKPGHPAFDESRCEIVASNRLALEGAARRAAELGFAVEVLGDPLSGEAAAAGRRLAAALLEASARPPVCLIAGGETVVKIAPDNTGSGGRCQELALAAARELASAGSSSATLLAAGTDGRDGPTDAAGAIVDGATWSRMIVAGRDPGQDLTNHNSYAALASAGALLMTGPTGTNVMDLAIGLRSSATAVAETTTG